MTPEQIIKDVQEKYGEYIEMAEDHSATTCNILACLLIKERKDNEYYKKLLKNSNYTIKHNLL